jgi:hypothetical protein
MLSLGIHQDPAFRRVFLLDRKEQPRGVMGSRGSMGFMGDR